VRAHRVGEPVDFAAERVELVIDAVEAVFDCGVLGSIAPMKIVSMAVSL
jgi:hypothetical protein